MNVCLLTGVLLAALNWAMLCVVVHNAPSKHIGRGHFVHIANQKYTKSDLTFRSDSAPDSARVIGTITYRERMARTLNAVIEVKLMDVSRADAAAMTIAEQTIKPAGQQVPIAFELNYDPGTIKERNRYVIQVRILENDQLRFINSQAYPVITGGHPKTVNVLMKPIRPKKI